VFSSCSNLGEALLVIHTRFEVINVIFAGLVSVLLNNNTSNQEGLVVACDLD